MATGDLDLLRFTTAGSVDDGKSTLVGRLLYDTRSLLDDQLVSVEAASRRSGEDAINLALLTDGLRAERDQKITIDVAYRYFATPRRRFIIADTPGHVQYTRNMVTGASTADLAVILIDATTGPGRQSHRHAFIASLLGIRHLIVAVNKMDLVGYAQQAFDDAMGAFREFAGRLTIDDITYVPLSALHGDNVVSASDRMPWHVGGPLLHRLETVQISRHNTIDFRFPVQSVVRPDRRFRGYTGSVASGSVSTGHEVLVLPSRRRARIAAIDTADGPRQSAHPGDAVVMTLTEDIDVSRGDMIVRTGNVPATGVALDVYLCWLDGDALDASQPYILAQTTRRVPCRVSRLRYRIDVTTLHREEGVETLAMNDVGVAAIVAAEPLFFDSYRVNRATGCFVLIDPRTNHTVAAGMIRGAAPAHSAEPARRDVVRNPANVPLGDRETRNGHKAGVVWLTGLPGSGKTTIARDLERRLFGDGHHVVTLDGDDLRHGLTRDLGFTPEDRSENIRRAGEVARLLFDSGAIVLCAFVSPSQADRDNARALLPAGRFVEVFVRASLDTCRARDPKGHYRRAAAGEIPQFTGVSAAYEPPPAPELIVDTDQSSAPAATQQVIDRLRAAGWLRS